jgi:hypothetical protein
MTTQQPVWKLLANLGDASPLEYGGLFVYIDTTGVYPPEMENVEPNDDDTFEVHRMTLDRCTFVNGVLANNPYHPDLPAWFADSLAGVAACVGSTEDELIGQLCSADPIERANGYRDLASYHGWANFDQYPIELTRPEAEARYQNEVHP